MTESISEKTARRMTLHALLLDGKTKIKPGKEGIAQTIGHLGYVQIDTISVIERAHHHVLWTRVPGYKPEYLHQAHAVERTLFEYWGHAASYLPMSDYRFYIPMMRGFLNPSGSWWRSWGEKYGNFLEPVLKRIREDGPLAARDFENPSSRKGSTNHPPILADPIGLSQKGPWWDSTNHPPILADSIGLSPQEKGSWWDWKPAKAALEMLFWRGELMIAKRSGFERIYDLTERVLPEGTDIRPPESDELGRFIVSRALNALGIANEKEIREYIRIGDKEMVGKALKEMLAANEIVRLNITGDNGMFHAFANALEQSGSFRAAAPCVRLLSPFDNLVSPRSLLKQRFGFDYALECYTPPSKRKHGYFVLPILFGENIVGRLDPKADRPDKTFRVRRLAIQPEFCDNDGLIAGLNKAIGDLAAFNGCSAVILEDVRPKKLVAPLKKALAAGVATGL
ncbi:MAG: winged helix DNA-binding domain-containing protein [Candidatus Aminicenantes bacterium]|nr:winged helix DNA-binding domain-containing protein [Candidatus Aminicenantes bacterium]